MDLNSQFEQFILILSFENLYYSGNLYPSKKYVFYKLKRL